MDLPNLREAASLPVTEVLARLGVGEGGMSEAEAADRAREQGANTVPIRRTGIPALMLSQLRSPLLLLLAGTAAVSAALGQAPDALIIGVILLASVGLGFFNEYRAARAAEALHRQLRHRTTVVRDGAPRALDAATLVRGDVVLLSAGEIIPADLRLMSSTKLECDESVLTGESDPSTKDVAPVPPGAPLADLEDCALMGTVVVAGSGIGVVVATGSDTEFGRLAASLAEREPETEFQAGLRRFSMMLVIVAATLTALILGINLALGRPIAEAILFSLAIAIGISPQLLPAVVSTSLASGARQLARRGVLIKRMVCIEDLGDIEVLFTDKTGTLTEGRISFMRGIGLDGRPSAAPVLDGLLCHDAVLEHGHPVSGSSLDVALWSSPVTRDPAVQIAGWTRIDLRPFDHTKQAMAVIERDSSGSTWLIVKGAPESVLACCPPVPDAARMALEAELAAGHRVVATARMPLPEGGDWPDPVDLQSTGFLVFLDPPRADAAAALRRLADLGIAVKIVTGDHPSVAKHVASELGLSSGRTLLGPEIDAMDDADLAAAVSTTTIFARVSPLQKARIVRVHRRSGAAGAFLGDGVNDALALHAADVGISVDSGTEVAKAAADVILLRKSLDVLADGVVEGRRIFANTMKYVLMGTSSNFGNMFSAATASAFVGFLPMLPSQILLNNLLYDTGQLAITTDNVDADQLRRPSHWDLRQVRRFMLFFGPISSAFDFATFAILLLVLHAAVPEFRAGWFVESLATQTLVVFAIRTRKVPFLRSRPSRALLLAALAVVAVGAWLPSAPFAAKLGFAPLPLGFMLTLVVLVIAYLVLIDLAKAYFYTRLAAPGQLQRPAGVRRIARRASRFREYREPVAGPRAH